MGMPIQKSTHFSVHDNHHILYHKNTGSNMTRYIHNPIGIPLQLLNELLRYLPVLMMVRLRLPVIDEQGSKNFLSPIANIGLGSLSDDHVHCSLSSDLKSQTIPHTFCGGNHTFLSQILLFRWPPAVLITKE